MCETLSWRIEPRHLLPTPHKYLYLWSDYHIKGARWYTCYFQDIVKPKITNGTISTESEDKQKQNGVIPISSIT